MTKLRKFKQKKTMSTKNMVYALALIVFALAAIVISKSYAIYKLEKKYDIIQSKIGNYPQGDVKIAVLVDGREATTFPTYEDNYKVESVECSNNVNATFDVRNWQINIADMSATSTKCTISFNSSETNEETPIAYSKEELLALNESFTDSFKAIIKQELLNETYSVGSIYMSTEDDTVEKVQNKFGGTWVKIESRFLVGASSSYAVNSIGGVSTHNHISPLTAVNDSGWNVGWINIYGVKNYDLNADIQFLGSKVNYTRDSVTPKPTATQVAGLATDKSSNIPPYYAVYMYKRTA